MPNAGSAMSFTAGASGGTAGGAVFEVATEEASVGVKVEGAGVTGVAVLAVVVGRAKGLGLLGELRGVALLGLSWAGVSVGIGVGVDNLVCALTKSVVLARSAIFCFGLASCTGWRSSRRSGARGGVCGVSGACRV